MLSCVHLFATPWTAARQAPLSKGTLQARILVWVAMPSSRGSSNPGIEPRSLSLQADYLSSELPGKLKNTGVVIYPFSRGTFQGIEPVSLTLQADSLPAELAGKPIWGIF